MSGGARLARAAALAVAAACGLPEPAPLVRIVAVSPSGDGVAPDSAFEVRFSGPLAAGAEDAVALARAEDLGAALEALEAEGGPAPGAPLVPAAAVAVAVDGGTSVSLSPAEPLAPWAGYALLVSSRVRDAQGRPVLAPDGRHGPFVQPFSTGAAPGPPPLPVLTEVRVDAETPEAGGEWVEVANLGEGALDLRGHRLAKRSAAGELSSCALALREGTAAPPGGHALLVGGAWDGREPLPAGTPLYGCGTTALLGGIANDRPVRLLLLAPSGEVLSTLGEGGEAPVCAILERLSPLGPDEPWNLACAEDGGTPGWCNGGTPWWECP
jgi:hypothetical protein